jgi:hypothetical protein
MDQINQSKHQSDAGQNYMDFDWDKFVDVLFQRPPEDPFTFYMEFLDDVAPQQLSQMLGLMLVSGSKKLYGKEIAQLAPEEIDQLQRYYRSIGFEVVYQVGQEMRYVEKLGKTVPVNLFQIDFKPCSQAYNTRNRPESLVASE